MAICGAVLVVVGLVAVDWRLAAVVVGAGMSWVAVNTEV